MAKPPIDVMGPGDARPYLNASLVCFLSDSMLSVFPSKVESIIAKAGNTN